MECFEYLWDLLFSFFTSINANQGLFVACTTVILLITNGWTLRHYKRQYELDRFLVFMPLKEENLLRIKSFFERLPSRPSSGNFNQQWSYLEKGKSTNKLQQKPLHKDAKKIISEITYAKHLYTENKAVLEVILTALHDLDEKIREFEMAFPTNSYIKEEKESRERIIGEYIQIIIKLRSELENFINIAEYQRPPQ